MIDWARVTEVANIVTAASAVTGVVLAAWLGERAIRIARADNGHATLEFRFKLLEDFLQAVIGLASDAREIGNSPSLDPDAAELKLDRDSERVESRLRVLTSLNILSHEASDAEPLLEFRSAVVGLSLARRRLLDSGRDVLAPLIFDDSDEVTSSFLRDIALRVHGQDAHLDGESEVQVEASDGTGVSRAFDGSAATAARLRKDLRRADWEPTLNESLRLVMPWATEAVGRVVVAFDPDGSPVKLHDPRVWDAFPFDSATKQVVSVELPPDVVGDWIEGWPNRFWRADDNEELEGFEFSPEELSKKLLGDVCSIFRDRALALVDSVLNSPEASAGGRWPVATRR